MPIRRIYADISELLNGAETLVLDADAAAGAGTITVKSITGVAINNILFFRYPGNESAEIIATHAATAPTGNTVTLAANLVESHPAGTVVYIIRYNQVRFYWYATEVDAETTAPTALAAAQAIDPTMVRNLYDDEVQTTGFYYYRFIDSINTVNSLYSDPIPFGAKDVRFAEDEVGYVLDFVRRKLSHEWDERFSKQTAMDEINACLRYIQGRLKRFSRYLVPDSVIGVTARGVFDFALPADIYDDETNKSILQMRIGTSLTPLIPLDEKEFDTLMQDVKHTQIRTQAVIGNTSLLVDNSYDFDDDGTLHVFTSNAMDEITYTGVTRSTTVGGFTGVPATGDGSIAATHAVDVNVWQGEMEGEPRYFNVRNGRVRIYPLPSSNWIDKNVVADYNQEVTKVDSESDTIDAPRYDCVKHWLLWQGKAYWRNNGKSDVKDEDFLMFSDILKAAIRTEVSGQKYKMSPKLNSINYRSRTRGKFDET
ncbi:MAG: hypothetical protein NUV80_05005 [Candidatus Berkelbacteria bacterium]|nr:hypothetical protein [Candidatus Berkelbacteria bacterium]